MALWSKRQRPIASRLYRVFHYTCNRMARFNKISKMAFEYTELATSKPSFAHTFSLFLSLVTASAPLHSTNLVFALILPFVTNFLVLSKEGTGLAMFEIGEPCLCKWISVNISNVNICANVFFGSFFSCRNVIF